MIVEVHGVNFHNKGSELMLCAVMDALAGIPDEIKFVVDTRPGSYEKILKYQLYQKAGTPLKRGAHPLVGLIPGRVRRRMGIVSKAEVRSIVEGYLDGLGFYREEEIDAVVDISGFRFGEQWGPAKTERMAQSTQRWKKQGKKIVLLPQALGPFESPRLRDAFAQVLDHADLVFARDLVSYRHVEQLGGCIEKVRLAPDFTNLVGGKVPAGFDSSRQGACIVPNQKMIQMTSDETGERYFEFLLLCIKHISLKGMPISIIIHESELDRPLVSRLEAACGVRVNIIDEPDPIALKGILGTFHVVVGSRYHALVSALSQGVPCLGSSWSHKYEALFEDYGCPEYLVTSLDSLAPVEKKLNSLMEEPSHSQIVQQLGESSRIQRQRTLEMWAEVKGVLLS